MNHSHIDDRRDVAHSTNPLGGHENIERDGLGQSPDADTEWRPTTKGGIRNPAGDPNGDMRRSGASHGDPHGGHNAMHNEYRTPDADPPHEMTSSNPLDGQVGVDEPRTSFAQPVEGAENQLRIDPVTKKVEPASPVFKVSPHP